MSTLQISQVKHKLKELFEKHLNLNDIRGEGADRDNKVVSRCLAALAIQMKTGCSEQDAAISVWDGGGDNGIDAAYYSLADNAVYLAQAKWINKGSGEPEAKEIAAFKKGVLDLMEQDYTNFRENLSDRLEIVNSHMMTAGTRVFLIIITTGSDSLATLGQSHLDDILKDINEGHGESIGFSEVLGLSKVYRFLSGDQKKDNIDIDATLEQHSYISDPYPAYIGVVGGAFLKKWWMDNGKFILAENIRHSLGMTDVNVEIKNTALNDPEHFWYFNNGITLIAKKSESSIGTRSSKNFKFIDVSIVNGAQTVSTLASIDDNDVLERVRVSIRVMLLETAPPSFGSKVTRTNNLQNRVEARDFVAQDEQQIRIHREMAMEGIEYQYVRSGETPTSEKTCELIEVTIALACCKGAGLAVQAKTGTGRFFNDLSKSPYKAIFNSQTSGAFAYNATVVLRVIDTWIDAKKKSMPRTSRKGVAWGSLVHGNRILAACVFHSIGQNVLNETIDNFSRKFSPEKCGTILESVYQASCEVLSQSFNDRHLAVFFKKPSDSTEVFESINNKVGNLPVT